MVVKGMAAREPYPIAMKFNKKAIPNKDPGNKMAVKSIHLIQFFPYSLNSFQIYVPSFLA